MTTANKTEKPVHAVSAAEARTINKDIAEKSNLPYVKVTGRTFIVRRVLWTMGGDYVKADKCYMVPAHQAIEAQALVDRVGLKVEESMAKAAAKKAAKAEKEGQDAAAAEAQG